MFGYPALMGRVATPFVAIGGRDGRCRGLSAMQAEVRPARFALLPGADGYKVGMIYEQAGWDRRRDVRTCGWSIVAGPDFARVAKAHLDAIAAPWRLPSFREPLIRRTG